MAAVRDSNNVIVSTLDPLFLRVENCDLILAEFAGREYNSVNADGTVFSYSE